MVGDHDGALALGKCVARRGDQGAVSGLEHILDPLPYRAGDSGGEVVDRVGGDKLEGQQEREQQVSDEQISKPRSNQNEAPGVNKKLRHRDCCWGGSRMNRCVCENCRRRVGISVVGVNPISAENLPRAHKLERAGDRQPEIRICLKR